MSSGTAKAALILGLIAAGKSFNILQGQPPLPAPAPPASNTDPRTILRGNFSVTRTTGTSGNLGLNPALDDFAQSFASPALWGSAVPRFPFTKIGLRALTSGPLFNVSSNWLFFIQVFVSSLNAYVVLPAQVQLSLNTTTGRFLDTGLVSIASLAVPGLTQLTPGVDIVTMAQTFLIIGGNQPMVGNVEVYGGF